MSITTTRSKITFDASKATTVKVKSIVKQAILQTMPEDASVTVLVDWGDGNLVEAMYTGSFYRIYTLDGKPANYCVAREEFESTHVVVEDVQNGYAKPADATVDIWVYDGSPALIDTIQPDGTIEYTDAIVDQGTYIVRWPSGAVGVPPRSEVERLYDISNL